MNVVKKECRKHFHHKTNIFVFEPLFEIWKKSGQKSGLQLKIRA